MQKWSFPDNRQAFLTHTGELRSRGPLFQSGQVHCQMINYWIWGALFLSFLRHTMYTSMLLSFLMSSRIWGRWQPPIVLEDQEGTVKWALKIVFWSMNMQNWVVYTCQFNLDLDDFSMLSYFFDIVSQKVSAAFCSPPPVPSEVDDHPFQQGLFASSFFLFHGPS